MPSPKDGKSASLVSPAAPREAQEADKADPGEVQEATAQEKAVGKGKYGSTPVKPFKPGKNGNTSKKTSWIEIALVDEENQPIPGEAYRITLPDGSVTEGTLDRNGFVRVEGFDPGLCQVTFPNLDKDCWESA